MIVEARCFECDKRIGCILIQGDTDSLIDTKYIKKISHANVSLALLCDKCRDGRVDLEEKHFESTEGDTAWQQHA